MSTMYSKSNIVYISYVYMSTMHSNSNTLLWGTLFVHAEPRSIALQRWKRCVPSTNRWHSLDFRNAQSLGRFHLYITHCDFTQCWAISTNHQKVNFWVILLTVFDPHMIQKNHGKTASTSLCSSCFAATETARIVVESLQEPPIQPLSDSVLLSPFAEYSPKWVLVMIWSNKHYNTYPKEKRKWFVAGVSMPNINRMTLDSFGETSILNLSAPRSTMGRGFLCPWSQRLPGDLRMHRIFHSTSSDQRCDLETSNRWHGTVGIKSLMPNSPMCI